MTISKKRPSLFTFTIDWEDFGQLYCKYFFGDVLAPFPKIIERQTDIILDMLSEANVKATFFVLGILARHRPGLVRKIASEGHEIALHGMNHQAMFKLPPEHAKADILDSRNLISDIIGNNLVGYRAPFFSIIESNIYLLEYLAECGFEYDSSIFPIKMHRYGIDNFSTEDKLYKFTGGREIVELPLTTFNYAKCRLPVSGGGYIRLIPYFLLRLIYNSMSDRDVMIYMHPYEFDTDKLDISSNFSIAQKNQMKYKIALQNLRWNLFRPTVIRKIKYILEHNQFSTCQEKATYVKNNSHRSTVLE